MWLLTNKTPFAAERTWTRDNRGAEHWLVVVRASFEIDPEGRQTVAADQTDVKRTAEFGDDPMTTGMRFDSDFMLYKAGTDVLLEGAAIPPSDTPAHQMHVRFKVADVDKTLKILGPRTIFRSMAGLSLTDPEPFTEMPIQWENTYGGWDKTKNVWEPTNPVGCGFSARAKELDGTQAPNVEYPDQPYRGNKRGTSAGVGPVAPHWQPRLKYAGTYDDHWSNTRDPLPPDDFDMRYWRAAPEDQQTAQPLQGYEEVRLGGFSAEGGLYFVVPRLSFDIATQFRGSSDIRQTPSIHTLWLFPNKRRFEIVYLSSLEVPPGREEKLVGSTIRLRRRVGTPKSILQTGVWTGELP